MSSRRVVLSTTFLMLAAGGMAACDSSGDENPNEDGHFYCTDANGTVIDEDYCDEDNENYNSGGAYFMYMGSSMHAPPAGHTTYPAGSKLPATAPRFSVTDTAARQKFGLPTRGRISNGTVKTGVIGKGGAGSAVKGGSVGGGGAKGGSGSGGG
jgi:hypothetical protein